MPAVVACPSEVPPNLAWRSRWPFPCPLPLPPSPAHAAALHPGIRARPATPYCAHFPARPPPSPFPLGPHAASTPRPTTVSGVGLACMRRDSHSAHTVTAMPRTCTVTLAPRTHAAQEGRGGGHEWQPAVRYPYVVALIHACHGVSAGGAGRRGGLDPAQHILPAAPPPLFIFPPCWQTPCPHAAHQNPPCRLVCIPSPPLP